MAAGGRSTVPIGVRLENTTLMIDANLDWQVSQFKQRIAARSNIPLSQLRVIFAGAELREDVPLRNYYFSSGTVVHAVTVQCSRVTPANEARSSTSITAVSPTSLGIQSTAAGEYPFNDYESCHSGLNLVSYVVQGQRRAMFYVFCKGTCQGLTAGKLRVRCRSCKSEAFEVDEGPSNWEDVTESRRIRGHCNNPNCREVYAEFYFRCVNHPSAEHIERCIPLNLVRTNLRDVPCLACTEVKETVLVFPCIDSHVICTSCFATYCLSNLDDRRFTLRDNIGYTIPCPGVEDSCRQTFIEEIHHFLLAGPQQYERYKNFAAEDYVLQAGGLLCPGQGCGQGILPESANTMRIRCNMCDLVFCRRCRQNYHTGNCNVGNTTDGSQPRNSSQGRAFATGNLSRSRWADEEERNQRTIRRTTKSCPGCNSPTEKNGGCNHMTCRQCQREWCWICRIDWSRDCESDHWFRAS